MFIIIQGISLLITVKVSIIRCIFFRQIENIKIEIFFSEHHDTLINRPPLSCVDEEIEASKVPSAFSEGNSSKKWAKNHEITLISYQPHFKCEV